MDVLRCGQQCVWVEKTVRGRWTYGVDVVLGSNSVRGQEVDDLRGGEASIGETSDDRVDGVRRQWDKMVRRDLGLVRATSKELKARATTAVGHADSTGELDAGAGDRSVPEAG